MLPSPPLTFRNLAGSSGWAGSCATPDEPDILDVAITVAEDYRGVGLGRVLGELLAAHRPRPARLIRTQIAAGNKPAMALLAVFGGLPGRSADGDLVIEVND